MTTTTKAQCTATNRNKEQCTKFQVADVEYCRGHADGTLIDLETAEVCHGETASGAECKATPSPLHDYCRTHEKMIEEGLI